MIAGKTKNIPLMGIIKFAETIGENRVTLFTHINRGLRRQIRYGRTFLLIIGFFIIISALATSHVAEGYGKLIEQDLLMDLQDDLYMQRILLYEKKIDTLKDLVHNRRQLEDRMLVAMDKYDSPLSVKARREFAAFVVDESRKLGLDPSMAMALIAVESGFDPHVVSNKGAVGMTQVMPKTGKAFAATAGVKWEGQQTLKDPYANTRIGLSYYAYLLKKYDDDRLALEAYNRGPGALASTLRSGGIRWQYSQKVMGLKSIFNV